MQQDNCVLQLLTIFLKYGLWNQSSFFHNKRFYPSTSCPQSELYNRQVTFRNLEMGTQQTYNFRQKFSNFFQSKTSVFRYNRWLVAVVQLYTPALADKSNTTFSRGVRPLESFNPRPVSLNSARIRWAQQQHSYSQATSQAEYLF